MEKIEYYLDIDNGFLLAYEKSTEFFVRFIKSSGEWEDSNISFSNFKHDYCFKQITKDEALKITNGCLPEAAFQRYLDIINKNLGI